MLFRARFRHTNRQTRGLLRPLSRAHGGNAPVGPNYEAMPGQTTLAGRRGTGCRPLPQTRSSAARGDEALRLREQAADWELLDDVRRIERTFRFRNFREALAFVQRVGELAENEGHHPDISFGWGYATVSLSTKKIKGLHENDFIMASKINRMFA